MKKQHLYNLLRFGFKIEKVDSHNPKNLLKHDRNHPPLI